MIASFPMKMWRKPCALLILILISSIAVYAQNTTQVVRGQVIDAASRQPLPAATVTLQTGNRTFSKITDSSGAFLFENIPTGRSQVSVTCIGYAGYQTDAIIVSSAKTTELEIKLEETGKTEQGVTVVVGRHPKEPVNRFALLSGRSFTAEETQRYAASVNDPGRMVLSFPGVQATRDTRSDVIIRGNNPLGMQWRLEGVDVVNPNHFARKGSTGGGITIFSLSLLDKSDFYTGVMPAEYGDALSGVFDMHFRKGNDEKPEYSFKAGMIGIDFAAEGPFTKNNSSYLVNYRYSTLGLLQAIGLNLVGERESNTFQDLSFNLAFRNKKKNIEWNFWGIGGISNESYAAVEDPAAWDQYDDYAVYDFKTRMGATGVGQLFKISDRSYLKSTLVIIRQRVSYVDDTLDHQLQATTINKELYENGRIAFTTSWNHKFSVAANVDAGVYITQLQYSFTQDSLNEDNGFLQNQINGEGNTWQWQPYVQFSLKPASRITINPGLHLLHLALNNSTALDPRLALRYRMSARQTLSAAYGLNSKVLPLGTYFFSEDGNTLPNKNLPLMRAHHFVLGHDWAPGGKWRLHTEAYYQLLYNVPVSADVNSTWSMLNLLDGYPTEKLISAGKGKNKGVDISLEKTFTNGLFMIGSFSIFDAKYQPLNGRWYNTRFNAGTSGSFTGAKEWSLKNDRMLQVGWKAIYNGGFRVSPILPGGDGKEPNLDQSNPFSEKIAPYFRTDARLALRKNKAHKAWQLALDIQNIFGLENEDALFHRYDPTTRQWVFDTQSGIVPVLSYQLDF